MSDILLSVHGLKTWFCDKQSPCRAVDGVDFEIKHGETFALLGESGCGKSMTALSLLGLNPQPASKIVSGEVMLNGDSLLTFCEAEMEKIRGRRVAMIFQEPQSSLNPVLTVEQQIAEVLNWHFKLTGSEVKQRCLRLLHAVGIPAAEQRMKEYPHQLSGGMKQRVMVAMALAGEPELLIADEPTTALDVTIQAQILDLLKNIQRKTGMAILLISHDLGVVAQMADQVAVMYAGQVVEQADREQFFAQSRHPYTQKLFAALPAKHKREQKLTVIHGSVPPLNQNFSGCRFVERCEKSWQVCFDETPHWHEQSGQGGVRCHLYDPAYQQRTEEVKRQQNYRSPLSDVIPAESAILEVTDLKVHFPIKKGLFQTTVGHVKAVDGLSLSLNKAETLAIVGESGCGKTTVGKAILQLTPLSAGTVRYDGDELNGLSNRALKKYRSAMQVIFQDPVASLNPRMNIAQIIEEGMVQAGIKNARQRAKRVDALMQRVNLHAELKHRYPHEFSGGQRQRICIARALAVEPEVIVCDEPTSALDVSVQAQILNLLRDIQHEFGLSYLFITHNIAVVDYLAHRVAVMYLGRIVEQGSREEVLNQPKHPYTQALLAAVPKLNTDKSQQTVKLEGELPSPANPPQGCHFHQRCPQVMPVCRERYPGNIQITPTHKLACFLYEETDHGSTKPN